MMSSFPRLLGNLWPCLILWACTTVLAAEAPARTSAKPPFDPKYEAQVGKETAAEIDKEYNRVDNKQALAKLQAMAKAIGANSSRPEVQYDLRLVKEKKPDKEPEVNAFSLPGGFIYVTEGLLKDVQSDHELAGVLAHEIAHNVNYDGLTQAQRANKIYKGEMAAVLATILIGGLDSQAWTNVMQAGIYYRTGVLGGYSIEMERRADSDAVKAMAKTTYDPVGLLTFMERLAAKERRNPPIELGIYQTHPLSTDRCEQLIGEIEKVGLPINRRKTANWDKPKVEERKLGDEKVQAVLFQGIPVFQTKVAAPGTKDAKERAAAIAKSLTDVLAAGGEAFNFSVSTVEGRPALMAGDKPLFTVLEADEKLLGKPGDQVAQGALSAIRAGLTKERLGRLY